MEPLIITVAPTGNVPTKAMTPHVPITPLEIATDIAACWQAGAAVAHIHARDAAGQPTADPVYFAAISRLLEEKKCTIVQQLSTGARGGRTPAERAAVLELRPRSASLATGSSNFPHSGNINEPAMIDSLAQTMLRQQIKPEIEVFDAAMLHNAVRLQAAGLLKPPLLFNFVLGVKGSLPATPKNLFFLYESLPPDAVWSVSVVGPQHVPLSAMAMALGGHVRVGVEDNVYYEKGKLATNVALVERMVTLAAAMGRPLANRDDVFRLWGIA